MLKIESLKAGCEEKDILKGLSLSIGPGEVHAIMGPNGSGKSTLSNVIAGHPSYQVSGGEMAFLDQSLLSMAPDERAALGIFMAFQYPVALPGVSNVNFLRAAYNSLRKAQGSPSLDAIDFLTLVKAKIAKVGLAESFLYRPVNDGFSGGEKKRNEVLQMLLFEPKLIILDETDSGLDIDALRLVADGVNQLRDENRSFIIVTHYQRLLDYIQPDKVHVLAQGQIIKTGDASLVQELEDKGYGWITKAEKAES